MFTSYGKYSYEKYILIYFTILGIQGHFLTDINFLAFSIKFSPIKFSSKKKYCISQYTIQRWVIRHIMFN